MESQGRLHIVREASCAARLSKALLKEADIEEVEQPAEKAEEKTCEEGCQEVFQEAEKAEEKIPLRNSTTLRPGASRARRMFVR
ncbi:MAG: hypothetical protein ACLTQI_00045 [Slackia sp.]